MNRKQFVLLSALFVLLIMCFGCSKESQHDDSFAVGNADAETLCYKGSNLLIHYGEDGENATICNVIKTGDRYCVVVEAENDLSSRYGFAIIDIQDKDSEIVIHDLHFDDMIYHSSCHLDDDHIVFAADDSCYIVDINNATSIQADISYDINDVYTSVNTRESGFVLVNSDHVYLIGYDGTVKEELQYDIEGCPVSTNSYISQNGYEYLVMSNELGSIVDFYEIDWDMGILGQKKSADDLGIDPFSLYGYGDFAYDRYHGEIYQVNINNGTKSPAAYVKNMLLKPAEAEMTEFFILDSLHFVQVGMYTNTDYEITIIEADRSLDLNSREMIRIKGDYATEDRSLAMAAYLYNISQNDFFVTIESWGEDMDWDDSDQGEKRNLKLIKSFQEDEAPDIMYGYTLDYDYLGKIGVVIDLMTYIDHSDRINKEVLDDSLYELMTSNNKCYYLLNGYSLAGLTSGGELIRDKSIDVSLYEDKAFVDSYKGQYRSSDVLYNLIGRPFYWLAEKGIPSEEDIERALSISINIGVSPNDWNNGVSIRNNNSEVQNSWIDSIAFFTNATKEKGDTIKYIGYPTFGGSCYMVSSKGHIAISAGSRHPDECFRFLEYLYSDEVQKIVVSEKKIPITDKAKESYIRYMTDPASIPDNETGIKRVASELLTVDWEKKESAYKKISPEILEEFNRSIEAVNSVDKLDFGLYNIIVEELNSYYDQQKPLNEIARSLRSRLYIYAQENQML